MKTYIFDPISDDALTYARERLDVVTWDDDKINAPSDAEACIVRTYKIGKKEIDAMPKLRIIAKHGVGTDNIDIPYAKSKGINCEVSLENMMACGIGACLCCVENTTEGHLCVCKEGPVFNINKLLWQI